MYSNYHPEPKFPWVWLIIGIIMLVIAAAILSLDTEAEQAQSDHEFYCEMVTAHVLSRGEYGWPDFHGIYDDHCYQGGS